MQQKQAGTFLAIFPSQYNPKTSLELRTKMLWNFSVWRIGRRYQIIFGSAFVPSSSSSLVSHSFTPLSLQRQTFDPKTSHGQDCYGKRFMLAPLRYTRHRLKLRENGHQRCSVVNANEVCKDWLGHFLLGLTYNLPNGMSIVSGVYVTKSFHTWKTSWRPPYIDAASQVLLLYWFAKFENSSLHIFVLRNSYFSCNTCRAKKEGHWRETWIDTFVI